MRQFTSIDQGGGLGVVVFTDQLEQSIKAINQASSNHRAHVSVFISNFLNAWAMPWAAGPRSDRSSPPRPATKGAQLASIDLIFQLSRWRGLVVVAGT